MRFLVLLLLFLCFNANAFFISANLNDSRLQSAHRVYDPSGIFGVSFETGFFNEPENLIDYKLSFNVKRFGYSFDDGDQIVSFWGIGFKPFTWSITYQNVMFEAYPSITWVFAKKNINESMENHSFNETFDGARFALGYGYRLGYNINKKIFVGINTDYSKLCWDYRDLHGGCPWIFMGGWGLSVQWNF